MNPITAADQIASGSSTRNATVGCCLNLSLPEGIARLTTNRPAVTAVQIRDFINCWNPTHNPENLISKCSAFNTIRLRSITSASSTSMQWA